MVEGNTQAGRWLKRHGWTLQYTKPHGFATTHYWKSPEGEVFTQTYALIMQRAKNKRERAATTATLRKWD